MGILPPDLAAPYVKMERYGILIVIGLMYLGLFEKVVIPIVNRLGLLLGVELG
jgi:hypothetical protein